MEKKYYTFVVTTKDDKLCYICGGLFDTKAEVILQIRMTYTWGFYNVIQAGDYVEITERNKPHSRVLVARIIEFIDLA